MLSAILVLFLAGLLFILVTSSWVEKKVDPIVFTAITRLLGIIVTANALQFILEGLGAVFSNWLDSSSPVFDSSGNAPKTYL